MKIIVMVMASVKEKVHLSESPDIWHHLSHKTGFKLQKN